MDEVWKEIPNTDYSVSDQGRVASRKFGKWQMLSTATKTRYPSVWICTNGKTKRVMVHLLVAALFLPPKPTPLHEVNHKNGEKYDNRAINLEWVTPSENIRHSRDVLGHKSARGERVGSSKLTEAEVREIRQRCAAGEWGRIIAADYGIRQQQVSRIATGARWAWLV